MASEYFEYQSDDKLSIKGDWTLKNISHLLKVKDELTQKEHNKDLRIDFEGLDHLDTNGAYVLIQAVGQDRMEELLSEEDSVPSRYHDLIETVNKAYDPEGLKKSQVQTHWYDFLITTGKASLKFRDAMLIWLSFFGETLLVVFHTVFKPSNWRITAVFSAIDSNGFKAVPIIVLLNFMVGAVVAFLGATVLSNFGATIYTVHLVGFSFFREFAVLLTAILIAGRTASSYAAQIGSMKVNEEIDALRSSGVDPMAMLVIPRVWALMISMPILTVFAMISGILGGLAVCVFMLDISPTLYSEIIRNIPIRHFFVGLSKAPIFAIMIAVTGCCEGFKVGGSAQSVGEHTTSSVVQSIFVVITIDAIAAIFFMEMGW
ncbi:MlaE family ABC transporter permease [Brackiella oedipodis]|uniref:MlaE family ABC transporter permease n=1 Tax=Brackiella oedipodis TaxID=124225 RepID=UPI00048E159B|nr:ABC transporter permease [Brackiella oedipodis]